MPRWMVSQFVALALLGAASTASAADVWTDPAPGIRQLVRTDPGPVRYVAVTIDLSRPEYYVRATRPEERGKRTSTWAAEVGAVVAINGDWGNGSFEPVGLAVGDNQAWPGTVDAGWSFMACTVENNCVFDNHTTDQARHHLWHEVVGGNGWRLLIDGAMPAYPNEGFYLSDRHPRSGVGLTADGKTMILAVAEGRRSDSRGVTFVEMSNFMKSLGAHQAMMLDGGGSSTLVVNGNRQNRLPSAQGSERVVTNHFGILRGTPSAECANVPNGRYCDGSVIHTCRGGQYRGNGDCGAFGAGCEVTSDGIGVCVHPFCTGGANGKFCEDETRITTCDYGAPAGTGDCAAFGATCETGSDNSYCVHFECTEGGNAMWCRDDQTLASCVNGQPVDDVACDGGTVCRDGACIDPDEPTPPGGMGGGETNSGGDGTGGDGGGDESTGTPTPGSSGTNGSTGGTQDDPATDDPRLTTDDAAGCSTSGTGNSWLVLLLAFLWMLVARRDDRSWN